jgi:hypothetical protein
MSLVTSVLKALWSMFEPFLAYFISYRMGKKNAQLEQERDQARADLDAVTTAADARGGVDDNPNGLLNDPYNRDKQG